MQHQKTKPQQKPQTDSTIEFIKHLIQKPASSKFIDGKFQHLYSNASYTMACAMLERVTGCDYTQLIKKTLIDELGIAAHIGWPNKLSPGQPWGHVINKKKIEARPPEHDYQLPTLLAPAGDLSLTPIDYAKYTQLHLKGLTGEDNYITSKGYKNIHYSYKVFSLGVANGCLAGKQFSAFDGSAGTFFLSLGYHSRL